MHAITTWLGYWTGIGNEAGKGYAFWSGIGSCLTYLAVLGAAWRHLNCHAKACWRLGKHPVVGTPFKTCRRHHPAALSGPPTAEHIAIAHRAAQQGVPGG